MIAPSSTSFHAAIARVERARSRRSRCTGARSQCSGLAPSSSRSRRSSRRPRPLANDKGSARDVVEELVDVESVIESLRDHLADATVWERMRATKRAKLARALEEMQIRTRSIP